MTLLKKLAPFLCILIAGFSVFVMIRTPGVPPWQIVAYTIVILVPCSLVLFWKPFDIFFGFAPPKTTPDDDWSSITPWIGWIILTAMLLVNHFARPPTDF